MSLTAINPPKDLLTLRETRIDPFPPPTGSGCDEARKASLLFSVIGGAPPYPLLNA
jgi:hypothetical protein